MARHHHHFKRYGTVVYHDHPEYQHDESEPIHLVVANWIVEVNERDELGRNLESPPCTDVHENEDVA